MPDRKTVITPSGKALELKLCTTCNAFKPPRSHHCKVCGNCVEVWDHHCPWVGNCVGLRNYSHFVIFLLATVFMILYLGASSAAALAVDPGLDWPVIHEWEWVTGVRWCLAVYALVSLFPVGGLAGYHVMLITDGKTTKEAIRGDFDPELTDRGKQGCLDNTHAVFCMPDPPSKIYAGMELRNRTSGNASNAGDSAMSIEMHSNPLGEPRSISRSSRSSGDVDLERFDDIDDVDMVTEPRAGQQLRESIGSQSTLSPKSPGDTSALTSPKSNIVMQSPESVQSDQSSTSVREVFSV